MTYLGLESRIFHIHGQKLKRVLTIRMYWRRGSSTVVFPIGINFIAAEISYLHWKRILCCVKVERIWFECWDLFGELTESVTEWAFYYLSHTFVWWLNLSLGCNLQKHHLLLQQWQKEVVIFQCIVTGGRHIVLAILHSGL